MIEPTEAVDSTDREKLANRIEKAARHLEGVNRESFIDDASLCTSCKWAMITRRASQNNRLIQCRDLGQYVPGDIIECNAYSGVASLSLGQMAEIAVIIDISEPKRVGFHQ